MSFQVGIGSLGERCGVQWTDGQTDGQTDRQMEKVTYRGGCPT